MSNLSLTRVAALAVRAALPALVSLVALLASGCASSPEPARPPIGAADEAPRAAAAAERKVSANGVEGAAPAGEDTVRAAAAGLAGTWEGEFVTPRAPTFIRLSLERAEGEWGGSIQVLGRTHELVEVVPTEEGVRIVLVPGPGGLAIRAALSGDRLSGVVAEQDREFPLELVRVPEYPPPANRIEAWEQDLQALSERFLRADGSFSSAERALFLERVEELRSRLPELSDPEVILGIAAAVSLSGNAHSRLYLLRNRTELRRLPVRLWWFVDGLYVVRATPEHRDLLGCRVDEIEGVPPRLARDRVATAFAGNPSWTDYKSVYFLTSPEALHGVGVAPDPERVELGFSACAEHPFRRALQPLPLVRSDDPVEAWWDLSPRHRASGWVQALEGREGSPPLYLRHPDRHYWFEWIPESRVLYFQYSRASQMEDKPIDDFGERLLAELEAREPAAFVLDLRFNTGGNLGVARELMERLQERTAGVPRFLITGRATFSAGITHVASWKEAGEVTIVGEPVGDDLDMWSEGGNILLPNSGLTAHFANAFHSYSVKPCPPEVPCFLDLSSPDVRPDVPVSAGWAEYVGGTDPALEAVLARMRGRQR